MNYYTVKTSKELNDLNEVDIDDRAYVEDESAMYVFANDEWEKVHINTGEGLKMSLYDINKQSMPQFTPLDEGGIKSVIDELNSWKKDSFYLLYGKEIGYFTILRQKPGKADYDNFGEAIIDLLGDLTEKIYSVEKLQDDNYEIWIDYNDEATMLYLADWKQGVVTFR